MPSGHRLVLLFPLDGAASATGLWRGADRSLREWDPMLPTWIADGGPQLPRLVALAEAPTAELVPPTPADAAPLTRARLGLFATPHDDAVLLLEATVHGDLPSLMRTLQAVRDGAAGHEVRVAGATPLELIRDGLPDHLRPQVEGLSQTGKVASHHVCVIDTDLVRLAPKVEGRPVDRSVPTDVDLPRVARIAYYDAIPYVDPAFRTAFSGVTFPATANRYAGTVAAVTVNGSVISGHAPGLTGAMILCHVLAHGATLRTARVRQDAFRDLELAGDLEHRVAALRADPSRAGLRELRDAVTVLSENAGRRQVALSFGAEAYLDVHPLVHSSVVSHYHGAVVEAVRLDRAVATATTLATRLREAIAALHVVVETAEREQDETRQEHLTRVGGVLAAIALVFTFIFGVYGADVSPVGDRPIAELDIGYGGFLVAIALLIWAIVAIYRRDWRIWRPPGG